VTSGLVVSEFTKNAIQKFKSKAEKSATRSPVNSADQKPTPDWFISITSISRLVGFFYAISMYAAIP